MNILGVNAVFHDPAAALVVDGHVVAAAEEERFSRRKHGKEAVPFSTWELPTAAAKWCLAEAGLSPGDLDAVGYSYDPSLMDGQSDELAGLDTHWEHLRTMFARRAPGFLATALPGLDPAVVRHVRHHVAHAASTALASPDPDSAVLVVDGRGERSSMLAGVYRDFKLDVLATQSLPHSLGLLYEGLTEHLGFKRSSDEYKVMAMGSYGRPRFADYLRTRVFAKDDGGFATEPVDWSTLVPPRPPTPPEAMSAFATPEPEYADLACSVQLVVEEVLLDLVTWLRDRVDTDRFRRGVGAARGG
jgi:carbamoyltransferase